MIMEFKAEQVEKYNVLVWQHPEMDVLRKTQCLCLNCKIMKTCKIAKSGYRLCRKYNVAFAMTRCPVFKRQDGSER